MMRGRPWRWLVLSVAIATGGVLGAGAASTQPAAAAAGFSFDKSQACINGRVMCADVHDKYHAFGGKYVGHDEPSVLYYSNVPGAGNHNSWQVTLPKDPPPQVVRGRSWSFQLTPAFWFGMALCDSQSYPEVTNKCTPDSDSNITAQDRHAGTAFMELQFYPPGWVKQFNSQSCDARDWCAAMNIDSFSQDPINGTNLNPTCQSEILGGQEYINFAFLTHSGVPIGAPNPLDFNPAIGGNPVQPNVLFMHPGDHLTVSMHDTAQGLQTVVFDHNTGRVGFMTASAANGFGQIKFKPEGKDCQEIPYNFHPMYSTSSPATRVLWTAHSYNIAFDEEIGHFDYCTNPDANTFNCDGLEGAPGDQEPADNDEAPCFPAADSLLVQVNGCNSTNDPGFDGTSYLKGWPYGNTFLHPTPELFSSPLTGPFDSVNYSDVAFEGDQPAIESPQIGGKCNVITGANCTIVPTTDDGAPATFYPFFSITRSSPFGGGCRWFIGNDVPGLTANDFGGVSQYGTLLFLQFLAFGGKGALVTATNDFQNNLGRNPCPARP